MIQHRADHTVSLQTENEESQTRKKTGYTMFGYTMAYTYIDESLYVLTKQACLHVSVDIIRVTWSQSVLLLCL